MTHTIDKREADDDLMEWHHGAYEGRRDLTEPVIHAWNGRVTAAASAR